MKKVTLILTVILAFLFFGCPTETTPEMVDTEFTIEPFGFGNKIDGWSDATEVWLVGDFNEWDETDKTFQMEEDANGIFRYTMSAEKGTTLKFKVIAVSEVYPDGAWMTSMYDFYKQGYITSPSIDSVTFADDGFEGINAVYVVQ